uniref:Uncharacterized protein n=1 Tax=Tanacetum cinerariifolium TaxID=118510 RepID=A0A6L2JNG5_TANCI|nr:hypothetical protein [Tanacetum cinerariifolium]
MAWLPKCEELERDFGGRNWLDMMIVYFDEYAYEQREFVRRFNGLISEMNEACPDRMAFVQELRSVAGESVPAKIVVFLEEMMNKQGSREWQLADLVREGKMTEFMKEMQDKDIQNLMKLQILGREFELRAREMDLFIQKLKGNMNY